MKSTKKIIAGILLATLGVSTVVADDNNPGGWDFEIPGLRVSKAANSKTTVKYSVSSSFSFGFIGGVSQDPGVGINMGQSFEIEWGDVINGEIRVG